MNENSEANRVDVKLIEWTGRGDELSDWPARLLAYIKNTRLEQGDEGRERFRDMPEAELQAELEYIANTIRSSWEFIDFIFEVQGVTRAFTHQLVRTRTASYAQQAQRVVDMSGDAFKVTKPDTVYQNGAANEIWDDVTKHIKDAYAALVAAGIPNQDARGLLPTNINTNIIVKMNLRTLADVVGKRKNLRAQNEYSLFVEQAVYQVCSVMPWVEMFLYPDRMSTPKLDAMLKEALGQAGPLDKPDINEALKELDRVKAVWG